MWQIRSILQPRWCCPHCLFRWPHSPPRCYSDVYHQDAQAKSHLAPSCLELMHDIHILLSIFTCFSSLFQCVIYMYLVVSGPQINALITWTFLVLYKINVNMLVAWISSDFFANCLALLSQLHWLFWN